MESNVKLAGLPDLADNYELTAEQIAFYQKNGHIKLDHVLKPEEVDIFEPILESVVREHNYHTKPVEERDTYGKAFIQITNLWEMSEEAKRFVFARRFAKIAAELMGVDGVRIYHDQALFKEPGGGHTPWHQDQNYWPLSSNKSITMWMPLVPISEEIGSMTFVDESYQSGYLSRQDISDESHKTIGSYVTGKGLPTTNYGAMAAGDATFHAGWTIHSAPGNPSDRMREVMTIIYIADDMIVAEPDSNARRSDLNSWFPGIKPGELAASPKNPVLYNKNA